MGVTNEQLVKRKTKAKVAALTGYDEGAAEDLLHDGEGRLRTEAQDAILRLIALVEENDGWIALNGNAAHNAIKVNIKEGKFGYTGWHRSASSLGLLCVSLGAEVWPAGLQWRTADGASGHYSLGRGLRGDWLWCERERSARHPLSGD